MLKNEPVITLLVACPDDVQEEAQCVYDVVDELNLGLGQLHGARLNAVSWKTHALPGIGLHKRSLPQDYNIRSTRGHQPAVATRL